ncbi:MAG TPA: HAMP domain-containing sensor histidine kinase, partial [Polyangia bacterium]
LQQANVSERWQRSVDYVISGARRMARLVDQLLDLARARQAGGIPIRLTPETDLGEVVRAAVDELSAAHPRAEIALTMGETISGAWDPDRLAQVASNLIGNAVVHGTGRVRVSVRRSAAEAILEVQNGGAPISAEVVPHIFEAFQRSAGELSSHGRGLGLGLFIAERIVAAHGGRIGVRSNAEDGTIFAVALPAPLARPAPGLASAAAAEAPHLAVG